MEDVLFLIGRLIVGGFFIFNAANHFMQLKNMSAYAGSKGVPAPRLATIGSGLMLLLGGASVLLGVYPAVGVALLVVFLVSSAFIMHNFWAVDNPQMRMGEMVNFQKNMALAGSALMFLMIPEPWELALL